MRSVILSGSIVILTSVSFFLFNAPSARDSTSGTVTEIVESTREAPETLLTKGAWKIQSVVSDKACDTDGDGATTTNIASEMDACSLDDIMYVHPDGKVIFQRLERCSPDEAATEEYDWTLTSDNKFTIIRGEAEAAMIFRHVSKDELVLVIPSEAQGEMYYFTVTYRRPG